MIQREILLPEHIYPVDDWRMVQKSFSERFLAQDESIFSLANGYLGIRGVFDEGTPAFQTGTYVNGFYESWPIVYGEEAYGFAKTGQTMLNVTDAKIIRLYVDDEPFYLPYANLLSYERALDMKRGTLDREILWETPAGKQVLIRSSRLVSFQHRHVAAISYEVTVLNAEAPVVISSEVKTHVQTQQGGGDPRRSRGIHGAALTARHCSAQGRRLLMGHQTVRSKMTLACGVDHAIETQCPFTEETECNDKFGRLVLSIDARAGAPIQLVKYITYHTSRTAAAEELCDRAVRSLDRTVKHGFADLLATQQHFVDDFWRRSDVEIRGEHPRAQQLMRFNLFHLLQASARAEGASIGARGLTGEAYEGHYFWDAEVYILPFLIYTSPRTARNVLKFRYSHLETARQRAKEVGQKGALFPWRTINGEEASAYYAAGTAQYHINADIVFAIRKYVNATGDREFLDECGAEILVETARLWADLGFYSERQGDRFCIHGVTGPDEYNTVVNNNTFTNLMARENLWYAADTVEIMQRERPDRYAALVHRTHLDPSETQDWRRAADRMYVPFDEKLGIHPQDDGFLERETWDFENTPADRYPLLLYYHPLVIYRHRVIKQADIVLAMFLLGDEFSLEQKRRNFEYYDPLTTGDSSLSAGIQAIIAMEIGQNDKAVEYYRYAALMDLADLGGNVRDGCHIASMGGTWMAAVYGLAGMRDYEGNFTFEPRLPGTLRKLRFPLTIRGQILEVDIDREGVTYLLRDGAELSIVHRGAQVKLTAGEPRHFPAAS